MESGACPGCRGGHGCGSFTRSRAAVARRAAEAALSSGDVAARSVTSTDVAPGVLYLGVTLEKPASVLLTNKLYYTRDRR